MVSLTKGQTNALRALIHGGQRPDGRSLLSLYQRGLVASTDGRNDWRPTTAGWHAINELRYTPEVQVPCEWEVDTWRDRVLYVNEGPEDPGYDEQGDRRWTRANEVEYQFNLHEIMKFYREVRIEQNQWMAAKWDEGMDREYENELRYGWSGNRVPWRDRIVLEGEREALTSVSNDWDMYYTGDIFFKWANDLYLMLDIGRNRAHMDTSYKYSLQDNEDEHRKFWSNFESDGRPPGKNWIYAVVTVD